MPVLSRFSSAAGFKKVCSAIQIELVAVIGDLRVPKPFVLVPSNALALSGPRGSVDGVPFGRKGAKVSPLIVELVSVFMVNKRRGLISGHQKPSNAVGSVLSAAVSDAFVSRCLVDVAGKRSFCGFWADSNKPNKITRIRTIFQHFTERFGYKFHSHSDTSYVGLVRGLTAATVSTPILSRGASL